MSGSDAEGGPGGARVGPTTCAPVETAAGVGADPGELIVSKAKRFSNECKLFQIFYLGGNNIVAKLCDIPNQRPKAAKYIAKYRQCKSYCLTKVSGQLGFANWIRYGRYKGMCTCFQGPIKRMRSYSPSLCFRINC